MAMVLGAVVDTGALLEVIWVSLLAGVAVSTIYSIALFGATRAAEARRLSRGGAAAGYGILFGLASLLFVVGVAWAVHLIVTG